MRYLVPLVFVLAASGCAQVTSLFGSRDVPAAALPPVPPAETEVTAPPPPEGATTVDEFDTTTEEEREAATDVEPTEAEVELGATIVSLGNPADPGIWLATPLVTEVTQGRVEVVGSEKSIAIELRPKAADGGTGSEMSLPALRLLEVPLTDLTPMRVYAGGEAEAG